MDSGEEHGARGQERPHVGSPGERQRHVGSPGEGRSHVGSPGRELTVQGGVFDGTTVMGDQNIRKIVNKTYNSQQAPDATLPEGTFRIRSHITVDERQPISAGSLIFPGILHNDVTGDIKIALKILPNNEKYKWEAQKHFSVPYHKNIINRYSTDTFNFRGYSSIYIAMELCDVNIQDFIKSQNEENIPFESGKYMSFGRQVTTGLEFLHSNNVIVRDLKPSNLLLAEGRTAVKITDFGLSKTITPGHEHSELYSSHGSDGWRAPETFIDDYQISVATDVYSLALILYFFWSYGKHPFGDQPVSWNHYIVHDINRDLGQLKIRNVDSAKSLLESMLRWDPRRRPTTTEVLNSQIFNPERVSGTSHSQQPVVSDSDLQNVISEAITQIHQVQTESEVTTYEGNLCFTPRQLRVALQAAMTEKNLIFSDRTELSTESQETLVSERIVMEEETVPKDLGQESSNTRRSSLRQPSKPIQLPRRSKAEPSLDTKLSCDASAPLCSNGFKLILVGNLGNKELDEPCWKLVSEIYKVDDSKRQEYQSKGNTIVNTLNPNDVLELQKHLATMGSCEEGIKCVVFAHTGGSHIVASALQENSLVRYFRDHDPTENTTERIKEIRRNLVVFTFRSRKINEISESSAKIAINIHLTSNKTREFGKTIVEKREGENVKTIAFRHNGDKATLSDFTNNEEVLKFIMETLRRHGTIKDCSQYGNL